MRKTRRHLPAPHRVIIHDAASGQWLQFLRPQRVIVAHQLAEVEPALRRAEEAVEEGGLYAAGFVSYEAAPAFDEALRVRAGSGLPLLYFALYQGVRRVRVPSPSRTRGPLLGWQSSVAEPAFHTGLARIRSLIRSGDTYQVNYTYRLTSQFSADPWCFFKRLMAGPQPPYGAYLKVGDWAICSASPELFFQLDGWHLQCRPMKGTAARGVSPAADRAQALKLQRSEKERAENVMIVDMVRHELGRVAAVGSVRVPKLCELEPYPTVWQMTSTVDAETKVSVSEIFRALFPPASVTGAPKVRTMEIIADLECSPRQIYTGAIGFLAPGRRAQFSVAIRTLLINCRTGVAEYGVGSGITWDSDPAAEWKECQDKAAILHLASQPGRGRRQCFRLLETMRWTPEEGYYLASRHLARLAGSARYFGFSYDALALRRKLRCLAQTFRQRSQRVRVLLGRDGDIALEAGALPALAVRPHRVALARAPVNSADALLYHKTTDRRLYEHARAACPRFEDVLLYDELGEITETTIANVAVEIGGRLCTPPVACGLLAGTLRAALLAQGRIVERVIGIGELRTNARLILFNSVRGVYPAILQIPATFGSARK